MRSFLLILEVMRFFLYKQPLTGCRRAFSLIELLVVIGIIGVLLGVAIPVLSNSPSNARRVSREIIKAHLQQARAHAISTGNATAVVIPTSDSDDELGAAALTLIEVRNESGIYAPELEEPKDASSGAKPALQRWVVLPGNIRFVGSSLISSSNQTVVDEEETFPVNYRNGSVDCNYIVFSSNGQIVSPSGRLHIAIAQAVKSGSSLKITRKNNGEPVFDFFQINRLTGRARSVDP